MPPRSFAATLDLCSKEAAFIWECLKRAALARPHLPLAIFNLDKEGESYENVLRDMFSWLDRLPISISPIVGDITNKKSAIQLDTSVDQQSQRNHVLIDPYSSWSA